MGEAILFYLFATVLILSAVVVISGRNPVHSVLFLIVSFLNAAGLFLLAQAELLAMLLVIVYVGAVAVLFLFVVMMLDINFKDLRQGFARYGIIGGLMGAILLAELVVMASLWFSSPKAILHMNFPIEKFSHVSNAHALGEILYTNYFLIFQLAGFVLLVAMIGAIVLTLRHREGVRRQESSHQLQRNLQNSLEIKKVPVREGVRL